MSRRSARRANRSRRTPQQVKGRSAAQLPWVPIIFAIGSVALIAIIAFVILQSRGSSKKDFTSAIAAEADSSASIPGQYVDLPTIYGGPYNKTAGHVSTSVDYSVQGVNPPVGGPHWSGQCGKDPASSPAFCGPAGLGIYRDAWHPETLVHNMEHGGVVVWYNFSDTQLRDQLEAVVTAKLKKNDLIVMAPYPDMEANTIALTSWTRIDKFPTSEFSADRVNKFIDANERRFNPENF